MRIAINGFGRIGRTILRAAMADTHRCVEIVAINEPADAATVAHLTQYDSTHGTLSLPVSLEAANLRVGKNDIQLTQYEHSDDWDWSALKPDIVLECSGSFTSRQLAQRHIEAGAPKVLFSQPADDDVDATVVWGVNEATINATHTICSAASCTTNAVIPPLQILDEAFGIQSGVITTIHSAMNDQPVIDAYHHTDLRKTRSAIQSIIPVDTELARGIGRILPNMAGKFEAQAMRVPTINVSAMDVSIVVEQSVTVDDVNAALQKASQTRLSNVLGYCTAPLASIDFNGNPHSGIVDASQTRVAGKKLVKILVWFDNEWAYANRMLDVAHHWTNLGD